MWIICLFTPAKPVSVLFVQQFFCFVDLGGQVGAAASIGVVQKHDCSVGLADLVLCDAALAGSNVSVKCRGEDDAAGGERGGQTYLRDRINDASFLVILGSNPPL